MADEERRLRFLRNWYAAYGAAGQDGQTVESVSGRLLTFDTKYALPLVSLKLNIEAVQSGSGDPSPTNIRPITGFGGASIYQSGADTSDYTTYNVTWTDAGTVYGGTLDINTGVLTVEKQSYKISDVGWYYRVSGVRHCFVTTSTVFKYTAGYNDDLICEAYTSENVDWNRLTDLHCCMRANLVNTGEMTVVIRDDRYSDANSFKSSMGNYRFCIPLRNPIVYQLTPLQITTLIGTNNIWSNAGTLEAEYIR